jgi:hypothetical protein
MRFVAILLIAAAAAVLLAGCEPGPNELRGVPSSKGVVAGFWRGLWNGATAPITFIVSLFDRNTRIYEVHNNGNWYDFGFVLGLSMAFGGGAGGASARRRRG